MTSKKVKAQRKAEASNPQKSNQYLVKVLAGFLLFVLPYFYLPNVMDKTLMPRLVAMSVFLIVLMLYFFGRKLNTNIYFPRNYLMLALILFLVNIVFSFAFSINYKEGFYELFKLVNVIILLVISFSIFKQHKEWQVIFVKYSIVSSLISVLIGLFQYKTRVLDSDQTFLPDGREIIYLVEGVMSHKNLFSTSLLLFIPFVAYGYFILQKFWRSLSVIALILLLILIVILQTRAVWLGIIVSSVITFVVYLVNYYKSFNKRNKTLVKVSIAGSLIVAGSLLFYVYHSDTENPYIKKLTSITDTEQNINRLDVWHLTEEMIRDHFLFGVGSGNWQIASPPYFWKYFDEKIELNWIRPHNDYLWVFSEKGIIGILLFLSMYGITIYYLLAVVRKQRKYESFFALLILWCLIAYMLESFFDFPYERPFHLAIISLFMSIALTLYYQNKKPKLFEVKTLARLLIISVLILSVVYSISIIRLEIYTKKSLHNSETKNWNQMLTNAEKAETVFKNLDPLTNPIQSYFGKAYEELKDYKKAEIAYLIAYHNNPTKIKVITNLARIYQKQGKSTEALKLLKKGLKIIPNHSTIIKQICDIYYESGKYQEAINAYKIINNWNNDSLITRNMKILEMKVAQKKASENQ